MPSDERTTENPPRSDIPGSPGHDEQATLAAEVLRQADELAQRRHRSPDRHELLRVMQQRRRLQDRPPSPDQARSGDGSRGGGNRVTQFDYLPAEVGWDTLLAAGELLITKESFESAEPYLSALGMTEEETGCEHLRGEILTLTHREGRDHLTAQQLAGMARNLRQRGFSAALTHMTVTGPVGKGQGGPQPATPRTLRGSEALVKQPKVAIIDTGISQQRYSSVSAGSEPDDLHQFPLGNSPQARKERADYLSFDAGHGTFVTGIIQQVAPDAGITVYRAMDSDGIGSEVDVACAMIRAVTEDENQIINLSLGCHTHDDIPPIAIQRALEIIRKWEREHHREVIVVAAAGNYGDTRPCWPAAFRSVVSVAGLARDMMPARWSSRGFWVTCSTVGQGLVSTFVDGTESPVVAPRRPTFSGDPPWAAWSGTSFAAPQIAGALASRYQADGKRPLRDALGTLLEAGRPLPDFGQAIEILHGV